MKALSIYAPISLLVASAPLTAEAPGDGAREEIAALLADNMGADGPGCIVGVASGDRRLYVARGLASVEWKQPITERTVFDIASNSKQFAAAIILQLVGEGKLVLDRPSGDYLPELTGPAAGASLRQLLSHTSGIRDVDSLRMLTRTQDEVTPTTGDALAAIYRQKTLNFEPGTDFAYSNSNYILLARIAELVEQEPFADILKRRLLAPAGMSDTLQRTSYDDVSAMRATPYGGSLASPVTQIPNWVLIGTSSIQSTAPDLLRWMDITGRTRADPGQLATVKSPGPVAGGQMLAYAGGLVRDRFEGHERLTHNRGSGGFRSTLAVFPGRQVSIAVLCNSSAIFPNVLADEVARRILPKGARSTGTRQTHPLPAGAYYDRRADTLRWIQRTEGGVLVKSSPRDAGRFFRQREDGSFADRFGNTLALKGGAILLDDGLRYLRLFDPVDPASGQVFPDGVFGRYVSPDLDVRISLFSDVRGPYLRIEPTDAFMRSSDSVESPLSPVPTGGFMTANGWLIRFPKEGMMSLTLGRLSRYPLYLEEAHQQEP